MWHQISYSCAVFLFTFQMINTSFVPHSPSGLPLWTWECINSRCQPSQVKPNYEKLQSLQMCNMLCASMQLWPQPTGPVSLATTAVPIRADLLQLQVLNSPSQSVHSHIEEAFKLFRYDLQRLERTTSGFAEWRALTIHISINGSRDPRLKLNTDEGYSLVMHPKFGVGGPLLAKIEARSFCGARHALETLQQLVWPDPYAGTLYILEAAKIEDAPRFKYRGLLLDTARNFFPISDILRTLDAMAASKLNTFHWHVSDSQAFSLKLASLPQLASYGAFGKGAIYTKEDVRKIVYRARLRGIRVLIEVDTPAHVGKAWNWIPTAIAENMLLCSEAGNWARYCNEPPCGQLNPRSPHVFDVLEAIYSEIMHLTGVTDIFHIGGDDISLSCWQDNIKDVDPRRLLLEYTKSLLERLENVNGKLPNLTLIWSSPLMMEVLKTENRGHLMHIGLQERSLDSMVKNVRFVAGMRTVLSYVDAWDLNSGMGEWYEEMNGAPFNSWQRIYEHRPWLRGTSYEKVLGAEATVWSSTLSVDGLDARLWPRAAAFAERLWSDRPEGATRAVHVRLDVHRSRLVSRGIRASPIWSMWCSHNTYTCG